jgi:hypothetical protein
MLRKRDLTPGVVNALVFATMAHNGQVRKGNGEPYIIHPLHVATDVARYNLGETMIKAALCHDVVEDTTFTEADCRAAVGDDATDVLMKVTKWWPDNTPADRKLANKAAYYAVICGCPNAINLKLIDRMNNMSDMRRDYALPTADDDLRGWVRDYYTKTLREFVPILASPHCTHETVFEDFAKEIIRLWFTVRDAYDVPDVRNLLSASKFIVPDDVDADLMSEDNGWEMRVSVKTLVWELEA